MTGFLWVLALVVLNVAIRAIAKKAQENRVTQAKRGMQPPTPAPKPTPAPATPTSRQVVRAPAAGSAPVAASRPVVVPPPVPGQPRTVVASGRAEVEAQHRARVQAQMKAQAEARARAQAEAQARSRAQAEAQARVRAQAEAQARARAQSQTRVAPQARQPVSKQGGSALQRAAVRAGGEEFAALHSRERVAQSLAKVQAAERKVADALPGHAHAAQPAVATNSIAANIRSMFRDRSRVREAFILSEVLGPARGNPIASAGPLGGC